MSKLIEILNKWMDSIEGDEASILDITITTVNSLEKFKAEAEPRLAKLDALEAYGVDNWEGYDEAMRSLFYEDEDDE